MYIPPYAIGIQMGSERGTIIDMHHELMENMLVYQLRKTHVPIDDATNIDAGNLTSKRILFSHMRKFHIQDGGLYGVKAAIEPLVQIMIPPVTPIICQRTHSGSEPCIMGGNRSGITQRTDVLGGIKTESRRITQRTGNRMSIQPFHRRHSSYRLCIVFNNLQAILSSKCLEPAVPTHSPVKVYRHHGAGARREIPLQQRSVQIRCHCIRFCKNRLQTGIGNGQYRCDVGVGRNNDLITRSHIPDFYISTQNQAQRIKPVAHPYGKRRTRQTAQGRFKRLHLFPSDIPATTHNAPDSLLKFIKIRGIYRAQL